jgi:hypothetical protein
MTTNEYCLSLLDKVDEAGRDPELAYLVRSRLRRAVVALERGRREPTGEAPLANAPVEVQALAKELSERVIWLCQPSEALDVRWKREWSAVLDGVAELRDWMSSRV